jgi:O-antigen/teichoic acid export membrane protein
MTDLKGVLKSRVTVLICGVGFSILTGRFLGPIGSGILATLIVYPDLIITLGGRGLSQSITYYVGRKLYKEGEILSILIIIWIVGSLLSTALTYSLLSFFTKDNITNILIITSVSQIPFALFNNLISGYFLGIGNIKEYNKVNWIPNVFQFLGTLLLVVLFDVGIIGALISILIGYIVMSVLVLRKLNNTITVKRLSVPINIMPLIRLGGIYTISLLVINLNYKIDVILLDRLSSPYEVGIYSKGVSIVQYLWEIPTVLSTIIFSRSAMATDKNYFSQKVCTLLRLCLIVVAFISVIFFLLSTFIMETLYGDEFSPSSDVQKILLPGIIILTIFKVLNMDLSGRGKPWIAIKSMIPSLIINIILNLFLNREYGAEGAAFASTISYTVSSIMFVILYSKETGIPIFNIFYPNNEDITLVKNLIIKYRN